MAKAEAPATKPAPASAPEGASRSRRAARHLKIGGEAGALALRLAAARLHGGDRDGAEALRRALGNLKGPLMKIAQLLATVPDALPPAYVEALRELQSNAPPMGPWFVERRMRAELGEDWQARFETFEPAAAAAASLGQVHRARADGRELACKLQYPDMDAAVAADMTQMRLAFSLYRRYDGSIDFSQIQEELAARLNEELDYEREARHMSLYASLLAEEKGVRVPQADGTRSSSRLLTMTWLEGERLPEFLAREPDQETRNLLARRLFRAWYCPFYSAGVIHGDPHLGNYTFAADAERTLNLLDFGCVRIFSPRFVQGVIDLYEALRDDNRDARIAAYETWGFADIGDRPELLEAMTLWARFLYTPLLEDRIRPIVDGSVAARGAEVAGRVHEALKRAGGVRPPREFVLLDRSALGLASVFGHLRAELNWHRLFLELAEDFSPEAMARRQSRCLAEAGLPPPAAS